MVIRHKVQVWILAGAAALFAPLAFAASDSASALPRLAAQMRQKAVRAIRKKDFNALQQGFRAAAAHDLLWTVEGVGLDAGETLTVWQDLFKGANSLNPVQWSTEPAADGDAPEVLRSNLDLSFVAKDGSGKRHRWERKAEIKETWKNADGKWVLQALEETEAETRVDGKPLATTAIEPDLRQQLETIFKREADLINAKDFTGLDAYEQQIRTPDYTSTTADTPPKITTGEKEFIGMRDQFAKATRLGFATEIQKLIVLGPVAIVPVNRGASWSLAYEDGSVSGARMDSQNRDLWVLTPGGRKLQTRKIIKAQAMSAITAPPIQSVPGPASP
jgi:hypothetical protein